MEITKVVIIVWISISIAAVESQKNKKCKRQKSIPAGRTCRKVCKTDTDCRGSNKKCLCDGICGMSCFNPGAQCPAEKDLDHGTVENDKLTYGGILTYACGDGYELKGTKTRTCGSDRKWSGKAPVCVKVVRCETDPENIENGFRKFTKTEATYSCTTGYTLKGEAKRKCQNDGTWSGTLPICVKSGCSLPRRLGEAFASFPIDKTKFVVGDKIRYKCRFGFTMSGNPNVTCKSDFRWSAAEFLCVKVNCGEPDKIENGYFEAKDFTFGTWITYKCNKGYYLKDPLVSRRYCSTSGKWSGTAPTCKIKFCPPPNGPLNGKVEAGSYEFNSVATYSCDQGYRLNGSREGRCQDDETWGELPICEVDIQCTFENPSQPTCGYKNAGTSDWKRLYLAEDRRGIPTYAMKYDGDGTPARLRSPVIPDRKPHCVQFYFKSEGTLQSRNDLTIEVNGDRIKSAAPNGAILPSNQWIGFQATTRTEKASFQYDIIAKGRRVLYIDDLKVAKGECDSPCKVSNLCQNGGTCVDEIRSSYCHCPDKYTGEYCENEVTCETPVITNGRVAPDKTLVLGSQVHFDCHSGYELRGVSIATCTRSGLSSIPTCIKIITYSGECPSGFLRFQLMCYRVFKTSETYDRAKETCEKYGANLVTVQSALVNKYIKKISPNIPTQYILWIGLRSTDNRRRWESGFDYSGTHGVENNLRNGFGSYCAAYEYNFWNFLSWRITYQSCDKSAMFICETWTSSAKSYTVSTRQDLSGVYRPVNGLLTSSGHQVFYNSWHRPTRYLYRAHDQVSNIEGWFIGLYNIRGATTDYWYVVASQAQAKYPSNIGREWRDRLNRRVQVTISENYWWTGWSDFKCDVTCGQGMQSRIRKCNNAKPGSIECRGQDKELRPCTLPLCKNDSSVASYIHMNKTYFFFPEPATWDDAKNACFRNNMNLAIIKNRQLSEMLSSKIRTINRENNWNDNFWVNGIEIDRKWFYDDGSEMVEIDETGKLLWNAGEPNGPNAFGDCIEMSRKGGINDHPCHIARRFICQEATLKNPCDRNPCRSNRVCVQYSGGYRCDCREGLVEPLCTVPEPTLGTNEENVGACASDPCFGDAKCKLDEHESAGFICFCKSGWAGRLCDKERKDQPSSSSIATVKTTPSAGSRCDSGPCKNGGQCIMDAQGYHCKCFGSYSGPTCEKLTDSSGAAKTTTVPREDPCIPDPCNNGGNCKANTEADGGFVCFCKLETKGKYCETRHDCRFESIPKHVELYRAGSTTKLEDTESILDGDEFKLKCVDGSVVLGEQTIKCKTDQWSRRTKIHCVNKLDVCELDEVKNDVFKVVYEDGTEVQSFPVSIESGRSLSFKCFRNGTTQLTPVACENGRWKTAIPSKCVSVTCPDITAPAHGSMIVNPPNSTLPYEPETRLSFKCDSLYLLSGTTTTTCKRDGSWSFPAPKCEESGCFLFYFDLNPNVFVRGHKFEDITAKPGDKFQLRCEQKTKRKQTVTCMGKDKWQPPYKQFTCE